MNLSGNDAIRDFMDKLTATTNVSKYVELPMIAVMGDTSSGKSSLLSSISGVELPSSSELTTRCPILLKMSQSDKTKYATVSIQWRQMPTDKSGKDIDFVKTTVTESEWDCLPDEIAKAQAHIIACTGKEVARDIVNVDVYAPGCHDLTLIDLPGIVRSRGEKEGESLVQDINGLIDDYLHNTRCVILAVVPANVDFHNSQIMAEAKKVDPETSRTIPVITKPDLIDAGGENDVLELLRGEKIKFDLGFHMVKGRGQAALDQDTCIEQGVQAESSFFDNTQPWRDVTNRDLFGTSSLRSKLGDLQMQMIRDTIPDIVKDMQQKKQVAESELREMGKVLGTPSERMLYFRERTHVFLADLESNLTGSHYVGKESPASAKLHKVAGIFRDRIAKGRLANISKISAGIEVLVIEQKGVSRGKATKVTSSSAEVSVEIENEEDDNENATYEVESFPARQVRRDPAWLMEIIAARRTHALPCFLNEDVFRSIASDFMEQDCIPHCKQLLEDAFGILGEAIDLCIASSAFKKRYQSLGNMVELRAKDKVSEILSRERDRLKNYLEDELYFYTQNHYLFENLSKKRNERFKQELSLALGDAGGTVVHNDSRSSNVKRVEQRVQTIIDSVFDRNQRKSVDEHVAEEMEAVLDSYGKVAMKRIIDVVPMKCRRIFADAAAAIRQSLDELVDAELNPLMQDCQMFRKKREELEIELAEMEKGLALFTQL